MEENDRISFLKHKKEFINIKKTLIALDQFCLCFIDNLSQSPLMSSFVLEIQGSNT